jgi:hypothetical protein
VVVSIPDDFKGVVSALLRTPRPRRTPSRSGRTRRRTKKRPAVKRAGRSGENHAMGQLIVALIVSTLQVNAGPPSPQVRLALRCLPTGELQATLRNDGTADTAVIFGAVLGNGAKYMVGHLSLLVRTEGQSESFRMYRPTHYPSHIGGRVDDWIVPLPVGASYALRLRASDFEGWRSATVFAPSTLTVRLELRGHSPHASPDARLFRIWTAKDALRSNEVDVPKDCRSSLGLTTSGH